MDWNHLIQKITIVIFPLIFAITLHEAAHGWVASKLGDRTALMLGRVTANPIKHIDPFGTILLPILSLMFSPIFFGWAKPVPVTWGNLNHPKRDMAIVALAGPLANLLMAIAWGGVIKLGLLLQIDAEDAVMWYHTGLFIVMVGKYGILINLMLLVFNLLPIPPLDGSRILSAILPNHLVARYERIEPFGFFIVIGLLLLGLFNWIVLPPVLFLSNLILRLFGLDGGL